MFLYIFIISLGAIIQGISGFGFAAVASPLIVNFVPAETMVTSIALTSAVLNGFLFFHNTERLDRKLISILLLGGFIGVPFGLLLISTVPPLAIRLVVGMFSIICALVLSIDRIRIRHNNTTLLGVGLLSGILQSSISVAGPPVALYLLGQNLNKDMVRKLMAAFLSCISIGTIVGLFFNHKISQVMVSQVFLTIPAVLIAAWFGSKLSGHVNQQVFRRFVLLLLILSGVGTTINVFISMV